MVGNRIVRQFLAMVAGSAAGTALGFCFWVLVAREFDASSVGVAAAAINTLNMLGTFSLLGLGTFLIKALPESPRLHRRSLMRASLIVAAVAGALLGLIACAFSPILGHSLKLALTDPAVVLFFVVGVGATAASLVLDQAALGLNRAKIGSLRSAVAGLIRFPIVLGLMALGVRDAGVLVAAWVVPLILSTAGLWHVLAPARADSSASERVLRLVRRHWREALSNHGLNLALTAGPLMIPVVAALSLEAGANAEFAMAWMFATFCFMPPFLLAISLFSATVTGGISDYLRNIKHTLPAALGMSGLLIVGAWLLGPFALRILGSRYAHGSAPLLDLLVLAGLWAVIRDHLITRARIVGRMLRAAKWVSLAVLAELGGAVAGAAWDGARGLCIGWLCVQALEAVLVAPLMVRILRQVPWGSTPVEADVTRVVTTEGTRG